MRTETTSVTTDEAAMPQPLIQQQQYVATQLSEKEKPPKLKMLDKQTSTTTLEEHVASEREVPCHHVV